MSLIIVGAFGIIVLLCVIFFLGMPVGFAMGVVGFCGFWYVVSFEAAVSMAGSDIWTTFSKYGLTVIPLFIFMGQIAFYSGVNERLYNAAYKWVGNIRGGLAMATLMACAGFSAICGSNAATAATMTSVAYPEMKKYKYSPLLSTGTIACGSTLGVLIPPSIGLIVVGLYTGQSIIKLFYAGVVPGILLCVLFMLTVYVMCWKNPTWGPVAGKTSFKDKLAALPGTSEMALVFLLVMGGLYFGFFTPSEAGAAGSFIILVISFIQRKLSLQGFIAAVLDTLRISCLVMVLVTGAVIFGRFLAVTRIPFDLADWVSALPIPHICIIGIIFIIYLIGGAVMDALALLLITMPIFFPVSVQLGYDPIWFCMTAIVVLDIGAVTPPVGACAYVVGGIVKDEVPLATVFRGVIYFLPAYILCVIILMLFPQVVTFLPTLIR